MKPVDRIFQAYEEGYAAILLTGRSLYDFVVDADNKLRPLLEVIRRVARSRYGMLLVSYSLAGGLDWDSAHLDGEADRRTIEAALRGHGLLNAPQDHGEMMRVFRGLSSLARTPAHGLKWADGRDLRFLIVIEFAEHLVPGSTSPGMQTDVQILSIEVSHVTGHSLALRSSGNAMLVHTRDEGLLDELVAGAMHPLRLPQPDREEKNQFVRAALSIYDSASFEQGLTPETISHLTVNTPNRSIESLLRASHRGGWKITAKMLAEQKNRDVEEISEGTLAVLNTSRAERLDLRGRNISTPWAILERYSAGLLQDDPSMPSSVVLVGPPGSGKTELATLTARCAKVAAYHMLSPKGGIVGETERKARLQQMALREWLPNLAYVDEITENLPLQRSDFDGDSGASRAVLAALLTALSDETRRGRSLVMGSTNCPWRMGAAMRSRFTMLPVLHPLCEDLPEIIAAIARRIKADVVLDLKDGHLQEAARIFYAKGANPRHIRTALSNALMLHGKLTYEEIVFAAHDLMASSDLASMIYADLWAIKTCSSHSFLPWASNPSAYPFPDHLKSIVDTATGDVRVDELEKRLAELRPHANL